MRRTLALLFVIALLAVGCGSDDDAVVSDAVTPLDTDSPATATDTATDVVTEDATDLATDLATDDATDPATDDATDLATTPTDGAATATASPSATDTGTSATFTGDEEIVCFGLQAVLDGYEDFLDADPDSDQQREAVELIGQFGREVVDVVGTGSAELEDALDTLHANAAAVVSEGQDAAEEDEVEDALATVEDYQTENC